MGAIEITVHQAECDNCQAILEDKNGFNCWNTAADTKEKAMEAEWQINNDGDLFCTKCVKEVTEDGVIILNEIEEEKSVTFEIGELVLAKRKDTNYGGWSRMYISSFQGKEVRVRKSLEDKTSYFFTTPHYKKLDAIEKELEQYRKDNPVYKIDKSIKSEDMKE